MKNKKGAEMTIGTIVIIVLAILVLVFLIYGFTTGWNNLWQRIGIYGGDGATIADVSNICATACAQDNNYNWNTMKHNVVNENGFKGSYTCDELTKTVELTKSGVDDPIPLSPVVEPCPNL